MTNNFIDIIISRRSIRKYNAKQINSNDLDLILKAACYAPSANNYQPWHFLVITDRDILIKLSETHPYAKMLAHAQAAILVCGDDDIQQEIGYQVIDCSAATQNILLAAHSLGIGSVWLGIYPREQRIKDIKTVLNIPEKINPINLVSLGYADEERSTSDRFNKSKIHYNKFKIE